MKDSLLDFQFEKLQKILVEELGEKSFRAGQIFRSLHLGLDFSEMTDLSKDLREKLSEKYDAQTVSVIKTLKSSDGTEKYLFLLRDGNVIEGVLMRYVYGNTICVSTQVGCRMNCAFCASGISGLVRNLTAGEIVGEVVAVNRLLKGGLGDKRLITNVVLMGSGEPLDNYQNVIDFLKILSFKGGLNISPRNVSLSTSGLADKMKTLAGEGLPVNLTVSLHSPFDEERKKIMPVAKKYSIKEILDACSEYFDRTGRRYIFEYTLIKGKNDGEKDAKELIRILKGRPCHVNIIRLNQVKEKNLLAVEDSAAYAFAEKLTDGGISATVRRRMGADIDGACGQLRQSYIKNNNGSSDNNENCQ